MVLHCYANSQSPPGQLASGFDRLVYDARSAGMGGASLAVKDAHSAPFENAACIGFLSESDLFLSYLGDSEVAGGLGAARYFTVASPNRAGSNSSFKSLWKYSSEEPGRHGSGEVTVLSWVRYRQFAIFGTKGALGSATMTRSTTSDTRNVSVQGGGSEIESLGLSVGFQVNQNTSIGVTAREARLYRAVLDYTVTEQSNGNTSIDDKKTVVWRGLEWAIDVSTFHTIKNVSIAAAIRNINTPKFKTGGTNVPLGALHPSLDIGGAFRNNDTLFAIDVRNCLRSNKVTSSVRVGIEKSVKKNWLARIGIIDGHPTMGIGYKSKTFEINAAFGNNLRNRVALSSTFSW